MLMGIFGKSAKDKRLDRLQQQVNSLQTQNSTNLFGSVTAVFPRWDIKDIANRYCSTDDVYSVVRRLSQTSAMIPMYAFGVKNINAAKQLKQASPYLKGYEKKLLEIKALEDLPDTDPVMELLENPSDLLSKFEFYDAVYSMLYLHGECILYKERGEVRPTPRKLHILFPQFVVLNVSQSWPQTIVSYDYIVDGFKVMPNIMPEDIIHIKYFNPNFSISGHELRGLSPLKVLSNRLTRVDSNMNVSLAQLQNGGVNTIVTMEDINDDDAVVLNGHKDNFYRFTANSQNVGSVYWAGGKMTAIPLGLKLSDMEVTALAEVDFEKLCNAYSISTVLFNSSKASTESNVKEMRKALYTDAALPNVYRVAAALQDGLANDFNDTKRVINADISGIPELQEDMKDLAIWLNAAWWIDPQEKREMMKYDRSENPALNNFIIPTGLQMLDDLIMTPDLPNTANDYNA